MWWIFVAAAAALILALILLSPLKLELCVGDGVNVTARFLIFKRVIVPAPPKKDKRQKKRSKGQNKKKQTAKSQKRETSSGIISQIQTVTAIIKQLLDKTIKHIKIVLKKLVVSVGSDEAAKTAMIYGAVCVACDELIETMKRSLNFKIKGDDAVNVFADFSSEKTYADINIEFSLNIISAMIILSPILLKYFNEKDQ